MVQFSAMTGEGVEALYEKFAEVPAKFAELVDIKRQDLERQRRKREAVEQERAEEHLKRFSADLAISERDNEPQPSAEAMQLPGERVTLFEEEPYGEETGRQIFKRPAMNDAMVRSDEEELRSAQQRETRRLQNELLRERQEQQRRAVPTAEEAASKPGLVPRPEEDLAEDSGWCSYLSDGYSHIRIADNPEEQRAHEELKKRILKQ